MLIMRTNTPVTKLNFNKALVNSTSALMPNMRLNPSSGLILLAFGAMDLSENK